LQTVNVDYPDLRSMLDEWERPLKFEDGGDE
jgi:hypothetical protein